MRVLDPFCRLSTRWSCTREDALICLWLLGASPGAGEDPAKDVN